MIHLALDLSKRRTGWATWDDTQDRPFHGSWSLGTEFTGPGEVFKNLYTHLSAHSAGYGEIIIPGEKTGRSAFGQIYYEKPLNPSTGGYPTTWDTTLLLIGLAATVHLWADAKRARVRDVNQVTWRQHFLGSIPRGRRKDEFGNKIKAPPINWKGLAEARCRELGFRPRTHDEAEALGILDYSISLAGVTPPWRMERPLQTQLGVRA